MPKRNEDPELLAAKREADNAIQAMPEARDLDIVKGVECSECGRWETYKVINPADWQTIEHFKSNRWKWSEDLLWRCPSCTNSVHRNS